ncbi:sulfotransferase family 2 domain-containing protein [Tropicimonas sp. S265A]|uniref:sulfotransferase family 2 domain-containing protein n=1 Tax=Tropicimonas sp. S265A TaxID=3415134 RepID=UPI003C7A4BD3
MPVLSTQAGLLYFAHVPKTGGTSVEEYIIGNYGPLELIDRGWHEARLQGERAGARFRCSDQHLVWADALTLLPRAPDTVFGIVRDPVARIISEYRFQVRFRPQLRWLTRMGFSVWLAALLRAARIDPYICDNHIRPQADFLPPEARVFRLEEGLDTLPGWIAEHCGPPAVGLDMHHSQKAPTGQSRPIVPSRYDLRLIKGFYAVDYTRFGYPDPDLSAAPAGWVSQVSSGLVSFSAPWLVRAYQADRI